MDNINVYNQYMYSYPHKNTYRKINKQVIENALTSLKDDEISLYFHIPFCSTKCGYCNLFSITNKNLINDYVDTMCNQILEYKKYLLNKNIKINNIIFGGGTPTILSIDNFNKIFKTLEESYNISVKDIGFDIETSPKETDLEKIQFLVDNGVNRVSIGVQSFVEDELFFLKRHHTVDCCENAIKVLKDTNVRVLNIDLIYGIPNQTKESLNYSLKKVVSYEPEEVFIYPLYERGLLENGECVADEEKLNLYTYACDFLKTKGYAQTSMRRFVKKLDLNVGSCGFENTVSFGCGGRSYIGDLHFCEKYKTDSKECFNVVESYISKKEFTEDIYGYILDKDELSRRFIIKNLGYYKGVNEKEYNMFFSKDVYMEYRAIFDELINEGLVARNSGYLTLTEKGLGYSDYILPLWISEKVHKELEL